MKVSTFLFLSAAAGAASIVSANNCCDEMVQLLPEKTSFPNSSPYNATEAAYLSLQESELKPACVVRPATAQDVSLAMAIISKNPQCLFAVKGHGHTPAAGSANIQHGVTIDTTGLSSLATSPDHSVAHVGAGAKWLDVYKFLEPLGLAVAGGRNGNVGVGGLLLGGGISHFTTRVGWACDHVVNYQLVLSNGDIIQANATSHSSLFHALRGGGNNFGIVTRFDLETFAQPNISVTSLVHDVSYVPRVFEAFTRIVTATPFDQDTSLVTSLLFNSTAKSWIFANSAVYTKPVAHPDVYSNLSAVPSISNTNEITSLATFADEKATPPLNWIFSTATFKPSSAFMVELFDMLNATLYDYNPAGGVVWDVALEPLAAEMLSTGATLGMDTAEKGYIMLLSALWTNSASRDSISKTARSLLTHVQEAARAKGLLQRFQYFNYADSYQEPLHSYGTKQFQNLRRVGRKYDSHGVLQKQLKGGYKLL